MDGYASCGRVPVGSGKRNQGKETKPPPRTPRAGSLVFLVAAVLFRQFPVRPVCEISWKPSLQKRNRGES
jgi:hypothetical protein